MIDPFQRRRQEWAAADQKVDRSPRSASASRTTIVTMMEIEHANNAGIVHGGTIMRMVDTAAGIAAGRHSRLRVVTAAMDDMSFLAPAYIGDLVTVRAMVNDAARTSMEVGVRVDVESVPTGEIRQVSSAHLVFVAIDENGRPTEVPGVVAESDDERRRQAQARVRREQRLIRKAALREAGASGEA